MNYIKNIISVLLMAVCTMASATTTVEVNWPFSIASSTTNYIRHVIEQANKDQTEFQFVLIQKTGAGGSIAANHVKNSKSLSLLATSNAFFVRPYLFPDSYEFKEFKPLVAMSSMPMGFVGRANSNWDSILKKDKIFIGVPGIGSFSYVLAYHFAQRYPQTVIVPYQGTTEALRDVAGGILDLCLDVPAMALSSPELYKMHYITGNNTFDNRFRLAKQNVDTVFNELVLEFAILAPATMDSTVASQISVILQQAHNTNPKIKSMYKEDFVTPITLGSEIWYRENVNRWGRLMQNIKIN